eukprot:3403714-Rhodomonas_salina.3
MALELAPVGLTLPWMARATEVVWNCARITKPQNKEDATHACVRHTVAGALQSEKTQCQEELRPEVLLYAPPTAVANIVTQQKRDTNEEYYGLCTKLTDERAAPEAFAALWHTEAIRRDSMIAETRFTSGVAADCTGLFLICTCNCFTTVEKLFALLIRGTIHCILSARGTVLYQ